MFFNFYSYFLDMDVAPDGVFTVMLHKSSAGLGFSLEQGKSSSQGDKPLTVKRIFKGDHFLYVTQKKHFKV